MKYYIGSLIRGEAEQYYQNIVNDIASRFNLETLAQEDRIPHITLKSLFETDSIKTVEGMLEKFCSEKESSYLGVKEFVEDNDTLEN